MTEDIYYKTVLVLFFLLGFLLGFVAGSPV